MAKLSEKHPHESEIAHTLLEPFRTRLTWATTCPYWFIVYPPAGPWDGGIEITGKRADDLEMKICEALVEARAGARSEV